MALREPTTRSAPEGFAPALASAAAKSWRAARGHPVITGVMTFFVVGGMVSGALLLPEEWSLVRRLAGGTFGGVGVGLLITAYRMIG